MDNTTNYSTSSGQFDIYTQVIETLQYSPYAASLIINSLETREEKFEILRRLAEELNIALRGIRAHNLALNRIRDLYLDPDIDKAFDFQDYATFDIYIIQ